MTEDVIARHLESLLDEMRKLRSDVGQLNTSLAVEIRASQDRERRITKLESDVTWAYRGLLTSALAWVVSAAVIMFGGKP